MDTEENTPIYPGPFHGLFAAAWLAYTLWERRPENRVSMAGRL